MKSSPLNGVSSEGLTTTVFPAATAAGIFMASEMSGPFQVMMIPTTPYGWARVYPSSESWTGLPVRSPWTLSAQPA